MQDCRASCPATFVPVSLTCRSKILANLQCKIFATLVQMLYECLMKIIYIRGNVVRHSSTSIATLLRMSRDCRTTVLRLSSDGTIAHQSRDIFSKLDGNSQICSINVHSVRLQSQSCVYIVNFCHKIGTICGLVSSCHIPVR